jgi:hypothetical protein
VSVYVQTVSRVLLKLGGVVLQLGRRLLFVRRSALPLGEIKDFRCLTTRVSTDFASCASLSGMWHL